MIKNTNIQQLAEPPYLDYTAWTVIFPGFFTKSPHKFSRAEAFFDLLCKQRLAASQQSLVIPMTLQILANAWQWNRKAVKTFVNELQNAGVVDLLKEGNTTVVLLNTLRETRKSVDNDI